MAWTETADEQDAYTEWERDDGCATIRLRERRDGSWVVRLDRLTQAPEGSLYREERVATHADAADVAREWRESHDVADAE